MGGDLLPLNKVEQSSMFWCIVSVGSTCPSIGEEQLSLCCMMYTCAVFVIWSEVHIIVPCSASSYTMIHVICKQACMFANYWKPNLVAATLSQNPSLSTPFILSYSHKLVPCSFWGQRSARLCTYLWGKWMAQGMVSKTTLLPFRTINWLLV